MTREQIYLDYELNFQKDHTYKNVDFEILADIYDNYQVIFFVDNQKLRKLNARFDRPEKALKFALKSIDKYL